MPFFIDRRENPKDKSLGSRQRFLKRARARLKAVVNGSVRDRSVADVGSGETVSIPTKGIDEPRFRHSRSGGQRARVFTGNREYLAGDQLPKPNGGAGAGGKKASDSGEGEDEFRFALTREEFLDLFFEDLELPDLVKTDLKELTTSRRRRAGISAVGTPTNLNLLRTMRNSYGRRLALKRPTTEAVEALKVEILALEEKDEPTPEQMLRLKALHEELERLDRRRRVVPYIDPVDLRFNYFEPRPEPNTKAVMFCLMDVSGSMGEREKDLAKRFFMLLHLFLETRYEQTDIVFIRHTHEAKEVDEETFFYSQESGGTVVSTALREMQHVLAERYSPDQWNIYAAQASDGENYSGDSERCVSLLSEVLMPVCQYYAYVEILDEREGEIFQDESRGAELWRAYLTVKQAWPNFAMKRICRPADIYPVFRELFAPARETA
jgi:uncharacterized protein